MVARLNAKKHGLGSKSLLADDTELVAKITERLLRGNNDFDLRETARLVAEDFVRVRRISNSVTYAVQKSRDIETKVFTDKLPTLLEYERKARSRFRGNFMRLRSALEEQMGFAINCDLAKRTQQSERPE